ncbi:hypothetical protein H257_15038 [Aphanomyces astaci]|uniref:Uncharacterized protein n=2 Tax=Aphanomyces astaci TaxID=112090 RepID=W4FP11_APHAT|nr:hypothetical protein H257_15038 [Aphanomyces astaci]ETV69210.1 hypothetical protein H257_15038 [Aphanomyces astaci]|eukprot:XP_009841312.1 hypothetical protein H257_15038 [Aphanomyces astaci]
MGAGVHMGAAPAGAVPNVLSDCGMASGRKTISLAGKVAIVDEYEASGGTIYATAKKHGIQCNQLSRWLKNKETLAAAATLNPSKVTLNPGKAGGGKERHDTQSSVVDGSSTSPTTRKRKRPPPSSPPVVPPTSPASTVSCPDQAQSSFLKASRVSAMVAPPTANRLGWEDTVSNLTRVMHTYNDHQARLVDLHRERAEADRDLQERRLAVDTRLADIAQGHLTSIQALLVELKRLT